VSGERGGRGERKAFPLRIDPALFDALRAWADDELRSVNGQIEFLLARAARDAGRWPRQRAGGRQGAMPPDQP
jgi:hypothetical protein